jgi:SAM-dependent methyltransferase
MTESSNFAISRIHQMNRLAWNEAAKVYDAEVEDTIAFLRSGGRSFCAPELAYLQDLATWCERAIHLQCAGGRDTLSLWNQGAKEVVGVDISDLMIAVAKRVSQALGAPAQWLCCDVLSTPQELNATADLVYTGRGALCWIMDIEAWARVVARLLKPGGRLYVFEGHPLDWVWDLNASKLQIETSPPYGDYFSQELDRSKGWPESYIPPDKVLPVDKQSIKYEHQWKLGDIINSLIVAGLTMERFEEHPDMFWNQMPRLPSEISRRLPHTFSLLMRKQNEGGGCAAEQ